MSPTKKGITFTGSVSEMAELSRNLPHTVR